MKEHEDKHYSKNESEDVISSSVYSVGVDKLYISVPHVLALGELDCLFKSNVRPYGYAYGNGKMSLLGKRKIVSHFSKYHDKTLLQFNLTQWASFDGFYKFIEKILGDTFEFATCEKLTYFVELLCPFTKVIPHVFVGRKYKFELLNSKKRNKGQGIVDGSTLRIGTQDSGTVTVYEPHSFRKGPARTRISVELEKSDIVPVDHPADLHSFLLSKPFEKYVSIAEVEVTKYVPDQFADFIEVFENTRKVFGVTGGFNECRRLDSNFDRKNRSRGLIKIRKTTFLDEIFENEIERFLLKSMDQEEEDFVLGQTTQIPKSKLRRPRKESKQERSKRSLKRSIKQAETLMLSAAKRTATAYKDLHSQLAKSNTDKESSEIIDLAELNQSIKQTTNQIKEHLRKSVYCDLDLEE